MTIDVTRTAGMQFEYRSLIPLRDKLRMVSYINVIWTSSNAVAIAGKSYVEDIS